MSDSSDPVDPSAAPLWYRPVLHAARVADRARIAARVLWWAGWIALAAGTVGSFLRVIQPSDGRDAIFTTDLDVNRVLFGQFIATAGFIVLVATLAIGMSLWVRAAASRLQFDVVLAHEDALPDLAE